MIYPSSTVSYEPFYTTDTVENFYRNRGLGAELTRVPILSLGDHDMKMYTSSHFIGDRVKLSNNQKLIEGKIDKHLMVKSFSPLFKGWRYVPRYMNEPSSRNIDLILGSTTETNNGYGVCDILLEIDNSDDNYGRLFSYAVIDGVNMYMLQRLLLDEHSNRLLEHSTINIATWVEYPAFHVKAEIQLIITYYGNGKVPPIIRKAFLDIIKLEKTPSKHMNRLFNAFVTCVRNDSVLIKEAEVLIERYDSPLMINKRD